MLDHTVLSPGDVVLCGSHTGQSRLVAGVLGSRYSHAAMYVGSGQIVHSMPGRGVQLAPISALGDLDADRVTVLRSRSLGAEPREATRTSVTNAARKRWLEPYGYLGALLLGVGRTSRAAASGAESGRGGLYCFELVASLLDELRTNGGGDGTVNGLPGPSRFEADSDLESVSPGWIPVTPAQARGLERLASMQDSAEAMLQALEARLRRLSPSASSPGEGPSVRGQLQASDLAADTDRMNRLSRKERSRTPPASRLEWRDARWPVVMHSIAALRFLRDEAWPALLEHEASLGAATVRDVGWRQAYEDNVRATERYYCDALDALLATVRVDEA